MPSVASSNFTLLLPAAFARLHDDDGGTLARTVVVISNSFIQTRAVKGTTYHRPQHCVAALHAVGFEPAAS